MASGNPEPKVTWSKRGDKAEHTTIDENKSELILEEVCNVIDLIKLILMCTICQVNNRLVSFLCNKTDLTVSFKV